MTNEIAFIFAAGRGERLRPLTYTIPKPLVKVHGTPMIDTIIQSLQLRGIRQIYIVVGYLKEKFHHLPQQYSNIRLIENTEFNFKNNISSMHAILDYMGHEDCFICDADLLIKDPDIFLKDFDCSCGFGKPFTGYTDEWVYETKNGRIVRIGPGGENSYTMGGISYLKKKDARILADAVQGAYLHKGHENLFWDNILDQQLKSIKLTLNIISPDQITEIDSIAELKLIDPVYSDIAT